MMILQVKIVATITLMKKCFFHNLYAGASVFGACAATV